MNCMRYLSVLFLFPTAQSFALSPVEFTVKYQKDTDTWTSESRAVVPMTEAVADVLDSLHKKETYSCTGKARLSAIGKMMFKDCSGFGNGLPGDIDRTNCRIDNLRISQRIDDTATLAVYSMDCR